MFNAQCTDGWPNVSPEAKKGWEERNRRVLKLIDESLVEIQELIKKPTPEFAEAFEKQAGQPIFLLPQIPMKVKGTEMVS
jgi:hypothetical protein